MNIVIKLINCLRMFLYPSAKKDARYWLMVRNMLDANKQTKEISKYDEN